MRVFLPVLRWQVPVGKQSVRHRNPFISSKNGDLFSATPSRLSGDPTPPRHDHRQAALAVARSVVGSSVVVSNPLCRSRSVAGLWRIRANCADFLKRGRERGRAGRRRAGRKPKCIHRRSRPLPLIGDGNQFRGQPVGRKAESRRKLDN